MTDLAAPDTRAIVQRRLIGLIVLLLIAFLLSLLLRTRPNAPDALPSVVIPLNGSGIANHAEPGSSAAPMLDAPEPEARPLPTAPAAKAEALRALSKPATPRPVPDKLAAKPAGNAPVLKKPVLPKPAVKPIAPSVTTIKPVAASHWFVAVGAYKDPMAAQAIANRIKLSGFSAGTVVITSAGERLHRVRAGPFTSEDAAESARVTLIVEGLTKAVVVSEK